MGKMYTFDKKLLCGAPELRIGDKVFSVDDRKNTVKKALKLFKSSDREDTDVFDEILKLAFGKRFSEIDQLDISYAAYQELVIMAIAAMTGQDPEELKKADDESFPGKQSGDMV